MIAKLFNVYSSGKVTKWITGDRIRLLQKTEGRRIDDCQFIDEQGRERWHVFCGMDFSSGDDLFALTYMAVDWLPSNTMQGPFLRRYRLLGAGKDDEGKPEPTDVRGMGAPRVVARLPR